MTPEQTQERVAELEAHVKARVIPKYEPVFPGMWPQIEMRIRDEIDKIATLRCEYRLDLDAMGNVHFHVLQVR